MIRSMLSFFTPQVQAHYKNGVAHRITRFIGTDANYGMKLESNVSTEGQAHSLVVWANGKDVRLALGEADIINLRNDLNARQTMIEESRPQPKSAETIDELIAIVL